MGRMASEIYANEYAFFLNTSCTAASLPGYLNMGFIPLAAKSSLVRCRLDGVAQHVLTARAERPLESGRIRIGRYGDVLVTDVPHPRVMAALADHGERRQSSICLARDERFFRWRFDNLRGKYLFYFLMDGDDTTGYCVASVSPNNAIADVIDWAGRGSSLSRCLAAVTALRHFPVISVRDTCLDDRSRAELAELGFGNRGACGLVARRRSRNLPLLVRPVRWNCREDDFYLGGLDVRTIKNWHLPPLVSDAF